MMKTWVPVIFIFLTACDLTSLPSMPVANTGGSSQSTPTPAPVSSPTPAPASPSEAAPSLSASLGIQPSIDLRSYDSPIQNQFGGTCSAFATAAAMNNLFRQSEISKTVSERHLWDLYGVYDMDVAISTASNHYLVDTQQWPAYSSVPVSSSFENQASLKITRYHTIGYGNINAALTALHQRHPLVMAIQVPSGLSNCDANISTSSLATSGQHVMAVVGYQLNDSISGGGYFILKNSWGVKCGDHGYHYYPIGLCQRSDLYCYFSEIISVEDRR